MLVPLPDEALVAGGGADPTRTPVLAEDPKKSCLYGDVAYASVANVKACSERGLDQARCNLDCTREENW